MVDTSPVTVVPAPRTAVPSTTTRWRAVAPVRVAVPWTTTTVPTVPAIVAVPSMTTTASIDWPAGMSTVAESMTRNLSLVMMTLMPPRVRKPALPVVIGMTRRTLPLSRTVIV